MNPFVALCQLASNENWCWKIHCSTCGHMHFRYALALLAEGKSPEDLDWPVHNNNRTNFGAFNVHHSYSSKQERAIVELCTQADLAEIAATCRFPDWLGYMGLVIHHCHFYFTFLKDESNRWARQLADLTPPESDIHQELCALIERKQPLNLAHLEACEQVMSPCYNP